MTDFDDTWNDASGDDESDLPTFEMPAGGVPTAPTPEVPTAQTPGAGAPPTYPTAQTPAAPPTYATWPPTAPQPGAWGPTGWGFTPPPRPANPWPAPPAEHSKSKRIGAAIAAVALVIASAGIGAAVAITVRGNDHGSSSSSSQLPNLPNFPFTPNGGNSSGNGSSNGNTSGPLDTNAIAAKVDDALVNINTTLGTTGRAAGTGMIISADGYVLTNNHVIADATSVTATIGGKGSAHPAKVIGYDVADDVALVKIDNVSGLKTVTFGDPGTASVGDPVVAIGNALGRGGVPTATQGKITALGQDVTAGDPGGLSETLHHMIQIDAPIQPGDSGGALVNSKAQVIGMNTAAASGRFSSGSNVGFAIPVDNAVSVIRQIQSGDESQGAHVGDRALLGVNVRDASDQNAFGDGSSNSAPVDTGALVVGVQDGSAASDSGIGEGDVIVKVDGTAIDGQNALHLALTKYHPGDKVTIEWVDTDGNHQSASVALTVGPPA